MAKRYRVTLTDEERKRLDDLMRKGTASVSAEARGQLSGSRPSTGGYLDTGGP
jgi:hypothetical protein